MTKTAYLALMHRLVDGVPVFAGLTLLSEDPRTATPPPGVDFYTELSRRESATGYAEARREVLEVARSFYPWTRPHLEAETDEYTMDFDTVMRGLQEVLEAPEKCGANERGYLFASWGRTSALGPGVDAHYRKDGTRPYVRVDLYTANGGVSLVINETDRERFRAIPTHTTAASARADIATNCMRTFRVPLAVARELAQEALKGRLVRGGPNP